MHPKLEALMARGRVAGVSMFGDRLDVGALADIMRRHEALHAYLDDAHGMSWCGARGAGSLIDAPLPWDRVVIATSLSKGFGAGGGVLVLPDAASRARIGDLGPSLMFSIQLAPPVVGAVCASARIHLDAPEIAALQAKVAARVADLDHALAARPGLAARVIAHPGAPTPIRFLTLGDPERTLEAARALLERGFLVNPVAFPAVPVRQSGLRMTVTAGHRAADVEALAAALDEVVDAATCPDAGHARSA